jgi:2-polyprenyl-3-methyl-5-hydroxy-6-metoxy-1,4-benzoquinol methylase
MNCKICQSQDVKFIFSKNGEDFYKCKHCSVIFQHPIDDLRINRYYEDEYFNKKNRFVDQFINWQTEDSSRRTLNVIKKYKSNGNLLDIGAAYGQFLKIARDSGFNIVGIEPNKEAVKIAKEKFNIDLENIFFDKDYRNSRGFDVITNFHVIEHVFNPLEFVRDIHKNLKDGGIAVFETPNIQSLNYFIMGSKWPYILPNEHLFCFSFKNLIPLLENNGFEVIYKKRTGIFLHSRPKGLTNMIYAEQPTLILRLLNVLKNFLSEKIGLGDHLFIVTKKIK